jgi:hypothetical protein
MKRMASQETPEAQGRPPEYPVSLDGFAGIGRAARVETAVRAQERGEGGLVGPDKEERNGFHDEARLFLIESSAWK